jgi:hypothetical protein
LVALLGWAAALLAVWWLLDDVVPQTATLVSIEIAMTIVVSVIAVVATRRGSEETIGEEQL